MTTTDVLKRELILSAIRNHNQVIQHLDTQYTKFIDNILDQKKRIIIKIQQQFYQQVLHLYNFNQTNENDLNAFDNFDCISLFSLLFTDQKLTSNDTKSHLKNESENKIPFLGSENNTQLQHENNFIPPITMPQLIPEPETNQQSTNQQSNDSVQIIDYKSTITTFKWNCLQCNYSTNTKHHFIRHGLVHSEERPYACDYCDKKFKDKCGLTRHVRIHNKPKITKKWKCSYCNYETKNKGHLTDHIRVHSKEKPFACNQCNKRFKQKGYLKTHIRIHTKEKPFECNYCNKRFRSKTNLNTHIRVHTNERPYKCKFCDSAFKTSTDLRNHTRIHTGERPYECSYCNKKFKTNSDCKAHIRIHTGEKPFKCDKCNKTFTHSASCRKHIKTCK
eukprot:288337_1